MMRIKGRCMMRSCKWLVAIGSLAVLALLGTGQQSEVVIAVNCPEIQCFRLLEQAINTAPEGAILQLGFGTYYELPLVISKSLTIRGEGFQRTVVYAVEAGALFTIQGTDHPITVNIKSLTLHSPVVDLLGPPFGRGQAVALKIEGPGEGNPEQLKVLLASSSTLSAGVGIVVSGRAQLILQSNEVEAKLGALNAENGAQLIAEENRFIADEGFDGLAIVLLQEVEEAHFQKNQIFQRVLTPSAAKALGIMILRGGRYSLMENQFVALAVGTMLSGKTAADFQRNLFRDNMVGILLQVPPCIQNPDPELRFEGSITGADNEFADNSKADLCPELNDYPWPPDFVKKP